MAPPPETATMWQIWQSVLLTLITASALWTARTVFLVRDEVRDLKHDMVGRDGKNGLRSDVKKLTSRVDDLEDWQIALEAVARAEREQYDGEDRRHSSRRLRDQVLNELEQRRRGDSDAT